MPPPPDMQKNLDAMKVVPEQAPPVSKEEAAADAKEDSVAQKSRRLT